MCGFKTTRRPAAAASRIAARTSSSLGLAAGEGDISVAFTTFATYHVAITSITRTPALATSRREAAEAGAEKPPR
jgi:ABC-type Mn2+/Zn2+ transport system permease subunit